MCKMALRYNESSDVVFAPYEMYKLASDVRK